jgi:hypothetical protein
LNGISDEVGEVSMLIPVKCKVCRNRVLFKASPDTKGTIEAHCKSCDNIVTYKFPDKHVNESALPHDRRPGVEVK